MAKCGEKTEVYSRVTGYFRPVSNWNKGKQEEFRERKTYKPVMPVVIAALLRCLAGCSTSNTLAKAVTVEVTINYIGTKEQLAAALELARKDAEAANGSGKEGEL